MSAKFEKTIMDRLVQPGWITTRGVLQDPTGQADPDDYLEVERVMKYLAEKGVIRLWKLTLEVDGATVMAAARPEMELDTELERRQAAARAEIYKGD